MSNHDEHCMCRSCQPDDGKIQCRCGKMIFPDDVCACEECKTKGCEDCLYLDPETLNWFCKEQDCEDNWKLKNPA